MAKLLIYVGDANLPTEIDSKDYAQGKELVIGRIPASGDRTGIYFRGPYARLASGRHALLRFSSYEDGDGDLVESWEICHVGKTNPTWFGSISHDNELRRNDWQPIEDGDRYVFGHTANTLTFCLYSQSTEEIEVDDTPTANLTPAPVPAPSVAAPVPASVQEKPWYVEVIQVVLNGPKGWQTWIWWLILVVVGAVVVVLIYG